jgi:hypothetical protein
MAINYKDMTARIGYIRYDNMLKQKMQENENVTQPMGFAKKPEASKPNQEDSVLYIMRTLRENMRKE